MEFTKENMRFYIFMRCKLGESAKLIHETLQTVCGDCAVFIKLFAVGGPLVVDLLPQDTTMTATYYVQNVLSQVKSAINEQRLKVSTSRTLLLHEECRSP
ncbi:hypothetical protein ElyMa_003439600 [Elysia marginata]|uniref:Uncharacterized protein n=1 Tax=Elysia marginata TaxID=1093978 RepID=A0AAV4JV29_9GAST|nr:hypothetical protein ElyMa_003439600 [Elysia marginata]